MSGSNPEIIEPSPTPKSARRFNWRVNLVLFIATVVSVFWVGFWMAQSEGNSGASVWSGWTFAVPLLSILLAHEFGHYIAARFHGVPASLPYFLPMPAGLSPFGTMGAIIIMPERIKSRRALLDIGVAGPLAGMVVAIPMMVIGLSLSEIQPKVDGPYVQEGNSLLYWLLKYLVLGPMPEGHDVFLHPTAFAAWAGFLVTFLNLLPVGQLDGGHIAYALMGERQNEFSRRLLIVPWLLVLYNVARYVMPIIERGLDWGFEIISPEEWSPISAATPWIGIGILLFFFTRFSQGAHPPVDDDRLGDRRKVLGWVSLGLFVLLFTPTPLVFY